MSQRHPVPRWVRIVAAFHSDSRFRFRGRLSFTLVLDARGRLSVHSATFDLAGVPRRGRARTRVLDDARVVLVEGEDGAVRGLELLGCHGLERLPELVRHAKTSRQRMLLLEMHRIGCASWRDVERARDLALELLPLEGVSWTPKVRESLGHLLVVVLRDLTRTKRDALKVVTGTPAKPRHRRRAHAREAARSRLRWRTLASEQIEQIEPR